MQGPSDYIGQKANELGNDPNRITSFVRDGVRVDTSYQGALRGPVGTLWAGSGSNDDKALLLGALLARAHAGSTPAIPDADWHTVTISVITDSTNDATLTIRTADLIPSEPILSYRQARDGGTVTVLSAAGKQTAGTIDVSKASTQSVNFEFQGPGGEDFTVTRTIFDLSDKTSGGTWSRQDRYALVFTTGWVPPWVSQREIGRNSGWASPGDQAMHRIAYRFLALSDQNARTLASSNGVSIDLPYARLTIVGLQIVQGASQPNYTIDLRRNSLQVSGGEQQKLAFTTVRSLFDASLESRVLSEITGAAATSASDVLAAALSGLTDQLGYRKAILKASLDRLVAESDGTNFTVSPESKPDAWVKFEKHGTSLTVTVSSQIHDGLIVEGLGDNWLLQHPKFAASDTGNATDATEVAITRGAGLGLTYNDTYRVQFGSVAIYENARFVDYSGNDLSFEQQLVQETPDAKFEVRNYFDKDGNRLAEPTEDRIDIAQSDLQSADVWTSWYGDSQYEQGATWAMLSRDRYNELKRTGHTTVKFRDGNFKDSEPIELWVMSNPDATLILNTKPVHVKLLELGGDYASHHSGKPTSSKALPNIVDTSSANGAQINYLWILDDPSFPLWIDSPPDLRIQQGIPGQVIDANTGKGVPEAAIRVTELNESGEALPDGQFILDTPDQAFGTFTFVVDAPGYAELKESIDLRKAGSLPLKFQLMKLGGHNRLLVFGQGFSDSLPDKTTDRARSLISEATAEPGVYALMPSFDVFDLNGRVDAWLQVNTVSGEIYPRLADGLFGATTSPNGGVPGYSAALACAYLKSASALDAVAQQIASGGSSPGGAPADQSSAREAGTLITTLQGVDLGSQSFSQETPVAESWAAQLTSSYPAASGGSGSPICAVQAHVGTVSLPTLPKVPAPTVPPVLPPIPPAPSSTSQDKKKPKQHWIGIELVDAGGKPVAGEAYRVVDADGDVFTGTLDTDGKATIKPVAEGICQVTFPNIDAVEWAAGVPSKSSVPELVNVTS